MDRRGAPPSLEVPDDAPCRRDVESADVRRVYPDLPGGAASERNAYLRDRDERAYRAIATVFPQFRPPSAA